MKVDEDDFGLMTYDPAYTNTASCRSAITFIDGEAGVLEHRGIPDRAALRAVELPRGRLPAGPRRAADARTRSTTGCTSITHHTYVHENIKKSMEGFRYDAHPMSMLLSTVGALSTFYPAAKDLDERDRALHGDRPADREDADAGGVRLPPQPRPALRLSGQRPLLPGQLPLDALQDDRGQVRARPAARDAPSTCSGSCTPTTSRTARPPRCGRSAPRRSTPTPRSPPASPRSTGRCTAAPTRRCCGCSSGSSTVENIPDFLQGVKDRKEKLMGFGHRVYKNYDPRARIIKKHVDEVFEVMGVDNPKLEIGDRAGEARARRRVLHRAQALPERRLLLGPDLRGDADPAPTCSR